MNQLIENLSPIETLALTIIGEGRGEPIQGQVAIASVIRNRLNNKPYKYKSYKDVCLENEQFSCWNLNDPNYSFLLDLAEKMITGQTIDVSLKQCLWVAQGIDSYSIVDNTKGALYYLTNKLLEKNAVPSWAFIRKNPQIIGNQTFFNV